MTASVVAGSVVAGSVVAPVLVVAGTVVGAEGLTAGGVVNLLVAETFGGGSDDDGGTTVVGAVGGALTGSATVVPMISMVAVGVGGATSCPRAGDCASARRHTALATAIAPGHADDRRVRRSCRVMIEGPVRVDATVSTAGEAAR